MINALAGKSQVTQTKTGWQTVVDLSAIVTEITVKFSDIVIYTSMMFYV